MEQVCRVERPGEGKDRLQILSDSSYNLAVCHAHNAYLSMQGEALARPHNSDRSPQSRYGRTRADELPICVRVFQCETVIIQCYRKQG